MGFLKDRQNQTMPYDMSGMDDPNLSDGSGGNVLAALAGGGSPAAAPAPMENPNSRKRLSTLDIIGAIVDEGAKFGDATPGYQTVMDRKSAEAIAAHDRAIQEQFNQQKLTAGGMAIDNTREETANAKTDRQLTRFGQASRGLGAVFSKHGPEGVAKAFPLLAKSMGMTPEETQIFGQALKEDPEGTIQTVTEATAPQSTGSQPKEKIISELLRQRDPTGALEKQYLDNVASGMSDYQSGQLQLGGDKLKSNEKIAAIRARAQVEAARQRTAAMNAKLKPGQQPKIDPATLNLALGVTGELRGIYDDLHKAGATVSPDQPAAQNIVARLRNSGFGQLIEGAVGTKAQTNRDMIEGIRPNLIRRISEATGMTAQQMNSDKDMKLLLDQTTDVTRGYEANLAAINRLEELIVSRAGAANSGGSGGSRPRIILKPRGNSTPAPGRVFKYNPKTGNLE